MQRLIRSLAQILCEDLARAEKAKDGKKNAILRKPATTTPKQLQTTWFFGKDWQHAGRARDLQSATEFPGILPFRYIFAKVLLFVKAASFFAKKGHCSNLIFGAVNTLAFWTPRSGPSQYSNLEPIFSYWVV